MPAACSVATSVQACFGCTSTPVASMNARTAGCVTFGHGRPATRRATRPRPGAASASTSARACARSRPGATRTLTASRNSSGTTLRVAPPCASVTVIVSWNSRPSTTTGSSLRRGEPAERGGRLVDRVHALPRPRAVRELAAVDDVGVHRPDRAGVHRVAGRLEHDGERQAPRAGAGRPAPRGCRSGGSAPPRGRRTTCDDRARRGRRSRSSSRSITATPPFMSAVPRPTMRSPSTRRRAAGPVRHGVEVPDERHGRARRRRCGRRPRCRAARARRRARGSAPRRGRRSAPRRRTPRASRRAPRRPRRRSR